VPAGNIIASGGIDLATGQPFTGWLTAPGGSVVITPLTTMVQKLLEANPALTIDQAESMLFEAFDLPYADLSSYDPINEGLEEGATPAQQGKAAQLQGAASQIVNVLNVAVAVINRL